MPSQGPAMGTIQGEFAKRQAGVGAKREGSRCQGERQSKKHPLQEAAPSPTVQGREGRQAGQGQRSSSLLAAPTSHPIYCNRQNPEKRPSPLPSAPPHLTEPLVLVFILPAFKPSLGEEDSNRKSKGPRTSTGQEAAGVAGKVICFPCHPRVWWSLQSPFNSLSHTRSLD